MTFTLVVHILEYMFIYETNQEEITWFGINKSVGLAINLFIYVYIYRSIAGEI